MKHLKLILILPLLAGCVLFGPQAQTPEQQLFVACRSVADAEQALRPFKPSMTEIQVTQVGHIVSAAQLTCLSEGDPVAALDVVRTHLRELIMQREIMEAAHAQ